MTLAEKISHLRAVSLGQVTHDRYDDQLLPGGCAFFGAKAAQVLGAKVQFLTSAGSDFLCESHLKGMDTELLCGGETTVFTNSYPQGGHRVQHVESQAAGISPNQFPKGWVEPHLLFNAPVMGEISPADPWVATVRPQFCSLSLQGFMKKGAASSSQKRVVVPNPSPLPEALFDRVNAVFLSQEDLSLFGTPHLLERLCRAIPLVYVTLGEQGCLLYEGSCKTSIGVYTTEAVDPTGAGDTFAMSTSLGLCAGLSPKESALFGAAAASLVVEGKGSLHLPTLVHTYERFETLIRSGTPL